MAGEERGGLCLWFRLASFPEKCRAAFRDSANGGELAQRRW